MSAAGSSTAAPPMSAATNADGLELLIGVMSFRSPVALGRRNAMRALTRPHPRAALRFVMSKDTPDEDAGAHDVLMLRVPESGRLLGTYLLNNAFFRYAVALVPLVPYIARADDDSYFDVPIVLHDLIAAGCSAATADAAEDGSLHAIPTTVPAAAAAAALPADDVRRGVNRKAGGSRGWGGGMHSFSSHSTTSSSALGGAPISTCSSAEGFRTAVVYGPLQEWYMWSPASMQATCFDFSHGRHTTAIGRLADVNFDERKLPRFQRECLHPGLVGPYPFAKGPLVGFSHSVASTLVQMPELARDEAYALSERKRIPLRNVVTGKVYQPGRRNAMHPSKAVVFDDIYYGYLILKAYANRSLGLTLARLSEYDKSTPKSRLNPQRGTVRIYHKLKTAERFGWVNRTPETYAAVRGELWRRTSFACHRRWPMIKGIRAWKVRGLSSSPGGSAADNGRIGGGGASGADGGAAADARAGSLVPCCERWRWCL